MRCWVGFGRECWRGMRAVRASVSWPARPAGLRKRSEAESSAYESSFSAEQRLPTELHESVTK